MKDCKHTEEREYPKRKHPWTASRHLPYGSLYTIGGDASGYALSTIWRKERPRHALVAEHVHPTTAAEWVRAINSYEAMTRELGWCIYRLKQVDPVGSAVLIDKAQAALG